jgi:hypothetical protein
MTPIGLLTLAGLGYGAYYLINRKPTYSAQDVSDAASRPGYMPGPAAYNPPGWDALLGTYQACIYGHCSAGDCSKLQAYFDTLQAETADEQAWIDARRREVAASCPAMTIPQLPDLFGLQDKYQDQFDRCFSGQCSATEVQALATALTTEAIGLSLDYPSASGAIYTAVSSLRQKTGVAGVSGSPHVGNCGCAECQAAAGQEEEEPCCEACARGVGACACMRATEEDQYVPSVRGGT